MSHPEHIMLRDCFRDAKAKIEGEIVTRLPWSDLLIREENCYHVAEVRDVGDGHKRVVLANEDPVLAFSLDFDPTTGGWELAD